jgi:AcrR family transcriptional regulator
MVTGTIPTSRRFVYGGAIIYDREMPRIEAETIVAHRMLRERQLLDAAERLLLDNGHAALTFTALSHATGLARNSLYEYFESRDELIAAVCEREFSRWSAPVEAAVAAGVDPRDQLRAYVDAQLDLVQAGRHQLAVALVGATLTPQARERIRRVHDGWIGLATKALAQLGHPEPAVAAALVQSLVDGATRQLHAGGSPGAVRDALHGLLDGGLPSSTPRRRRPARERRALSVDPPAAAPAPGPAAQPAESMTIAPNSSAR